MKSKSRPENKRLAVVIAELTARSREQVASFRRIRRRHASLLKKLDASEKAMAKLLAKSGKLAGRKK